MSVVSKCELSVNCYVYCCKYIDVCFVKLMCRLSKMAQPYAGISSCIICHHEVVDDLSFHSNTQ